MNRRELVFGFAALPPLAAGPKDTPDVPTRQAKVAKLFKSPDGHPNGLETAKEGLWIGEQVTDNAYLVDWNGKVLRKVATESSNTSGIAFGMGSLWLAANGKATRRPPKPTDEPVGAVVEVDPNTGKTLSRHPIPGGGVHGLEFVKDTLWITSLKIQKLSQVNPKTWQLIHQIPVHLGRAHGLAWDKGGAIWCVHSNDRVIHKLNARDGRILEVIRLSKDAPDPHGMCLYKGHLYYCDAGFAPGGTVTTSPSAGYVCRIDL